LQLVKLRTGGYKPGELRAVTDDDATRIRAAAIEVGAIMLHADKKAAGKLSEYSEAKAQFIEAVDALFPSKFPFLVYAAQLLQYYVIKCDADVMASGKTVEEYQIAVGHKVKRFGDSSENAFMMEHLLVLLYNDLARLEDRIGALSADAAQNSMELATEQLNAIEPRVMSLVTDAPDSVFSRYLMFVVHYSRAKLAEVAFKAFLKGKKLGDPTEVADADLGAHQLSLIQKQFLLQALEDLEAMAAIRKSAASKGCLERGSEFALGQGVLSKLPVGSLDAVLAHVRKLLA